MASKINLPLFSQRDPRWAKKSLGQSHSTIGDYGCLLTCLAMEAKYYGHDTDPDNLNNELIKVGGYSAPTGSTEKNLYSWYTGLTKVYNDITITKLQSTPQAITSAQFAEIKAEIDAGRPVILQVDFRPATPAPDMHYVVCAGYDGDEFFVADPWFGDVANLTRYGVPKVTIQQYVFHSGKVVIAPSDDCEKKLKEALADSEYQKGEKEKYKGLRDDAINAQDKLKAQLDKAVELANIQEQQANTLRQSLADVSNLNTSLKENYDKLLNDKSIVDVMLIDQKKEIDTLKSQKYTVPESISFFLNSLFDWRWKK